MEILAFLIVACLLIAMLGLTLKIICFVLSFFILLLPVALGFSLGIYLWQQGADNIGVLVMGISLYLQYIWSSKSWKPKDDILSTLADFLNN